MITSDVSLLETVKAAEFFLADGVILTGNATGEETNVRDLLGISFLDSRSKFLYYVIENNIIMPFRYFCIYSHNLYII